MTEYGNRCDLCRELHDARTSVAVWADGEPMLFCPACVDLCRADVEVMQTEPGVYAPKWLYYMGLITETEYRAEVCDVG